MRGLATSEPSARGASLLAAFWTAAVLVPAGSRASEPQVPEDGEPMVEEITVQAPSRLAQRRSPGNGLTVQVVSRAELERSGAQTLQEALRGLPGLNLTDGQGNPFQQDLSMRGFTASPVTGLAQGLSVFLDGVRVNEPAVEEANFDLIPLADVERIEVVRGPSAIYGRNTIGGAISIVTRRGGSTPEAEVEVEGGSFLEQGVRGRLSGPVGPLVGYLSVGERTERGWRADGAAAGVQTFAKLGLLRGETDATLSYQFQLDRLEEPGSLPLSLLLQDPRQNYTAGDFFKPMLNLVTLNARQRIAPGLSIAANVFLRALNAEQFNSSLLSPDTRLFNDTLSLGAALQVDHRATLGVLENALAAGAEVTDNRVHITVYEEPNSRFTTNGSGTPLPTLGFDLSDAQLGVGVFAQNHLGITSGPLSGLGATVALRFDWISHRIVDASPAAPGNANGDIAFQAWVPAASLSWAFAPRWLASVSYTDGFRAPAFLELTCANPQAPCVGLQAGVAPDPSFTPLRPVRTRSFEAGVSGSPLAGVTASVNAFLVNLHDDIYSVTSPGTTLVFFQNIGDTRRQGLELSLHVLEGIFGLDAAYAYTLATFQSDLVLATPRTPSGVENVQRGDQLPLVPNHVLNLEGRVRPFAWLTLSAGALFVSSQAFRGDEANVAPKLAPYWIFRAGAEGRWGPWGAFVRVLNLANASYQTFGTFSPDARTAAQPIVPFLTPGLPLRVVLGVRWELG